MTDRDFKLLVRKFFVCTDALTSDWLCSKSGKAHVIKTMTEVERQIRKELEDFTRRDVEELPFKETEI